PLSGRACISTVPRSSRIGVNAPPSGRKPTTTLASLNVTPPWWPTLRAVSLYSMTRPWVNWLGPGMLAGMLIWNLAMSNPCAWSAGMSAGPAAGAATRPGARVTCPGSSSAGSWAGSGPLSTMRSSSRSRRRGVPHDFRAARDERNMILSLTNVRWGYAAKVAEYRMNRFPLGRPLRGRDGFGPFFAVFTRQASPNVPALSNPVDRAAGAQRHGALHRVAQLADVARPG